MLKDNNYINISEETKANTAVSSTDLDKQKKLIEPVNKEVTDTLYPTNEILKRLIFFKAKLNITQFAKKVNVSRQCVHGLINGTHRASPGLASKICEVLEEDTRVVFADGSIKYPDFFGKEKKNE